MSDTIYAVHTACISGAKAVSVTVEVSLSGGIPGMTIVGMPDAGVLDARWRVRCALKSAGFTLPRQHVTVNLAPGELRKTGTGFDVPIAVAVLVASGQISRQKLDQCLFVGELALDSSLKAVRGMVAYALLAEQQGLTVVTAPAVRLPGELAHRLLVLSTLSQLRDGIGSLESAPQELCADEDEVAKHLDFSDVIDQEVAKRAFVIAAAGRHGMLMIGPPGAGKSMLAKRMPTILSPLSQIEEVQTTLIHSLVGAQVQGMRHVRPFRAPHHSISIAGMVGGGRPVLPGEISLAHKGVLFLDELPEFAPSVLQSLRQPLEDKEVRIVRADGTYRFPCDFQLLAAANPCPCGYLGDPGHVCKCTPLQIARYQSRIGGPLMDRIDIVIYVSRPKEDRVINGVRGKSSADMAEVVSAAREFTSWRTSRSESQDVSNDCVGEVRAACLDARATSILESIARRKAFGGRAISRVVRVARTIADIAAHELVETQDVIEACSYRATLE